MAKKRQPINGGRPTDNFPNWPDTHIHPAEDLMGGWPKDVVEKMMDDAKPKLNINHNSGIIIAGTVGEILMENEIQKHLKPNNK